MKNYKVIREDDRYTIGQWGEGYNTYIVNDGICQYYWWDTEAAAQAAADAYNAYDGAEWLGEHDYGDDRMTLEDSRHAPPRAVELYQLFNAVDTAPDLELLVDSIDAVNRQAKVYRNEMWAINDGEDGTLGLDVDTLDDLKTACYQAKDDALKRLFQLGHAKITGYLLQNDRVYLYAYQVLNKTFHSLENFSEFSWGDDELPFLGDVGFFAVPIPTDEALENINLWLAANEEKEN